MRSAAARIHGSARGTSLTSSHAQNSPQKISSTVASSVSSPAHSAANASSEKVSPNKPPRFEDAAGLCEPSAPDGPVAEDVTGDPGERACRPASGHGGAVTTVDDVGALVLHGGSEVLTLQIQRFGKTFEHLARLGFPQSELEYPAGGSTVASTQRRKPSSIRDELTSR